MLVINLCHHRAAVCCMARASFILQARHRTQAPALCFFFKSSLSSNDRLALVDIKAGRRLWSALFAFHGFSHLYMSSVIDTETLIGTAAAIILAFP